MLHVLFTSLSASNTQNIVFMVIDQMTKTANYIPYRDNMSTKPLTNLILCNFFKTHFITKTIVLDTQRNYFHLSYQKIAHQALSNPASPRHCTTHMHQSHRKIVNKAVIYYNFQFFPHHQENQEILLYKDKFSYNKKLHNHWYFNLTGSLQVKPHICWRSFGKQIYLFF